MKMSKAPDLLAIPYGTPTVRAHVVAQLARQDFAELDAPGAPVAVVDPAAGGPLRMSGLLHPFTRPPVAQDLAHAVSQLSFLEAHIVRLSGDWSKPQQAFIRRYFAALRNHVERRSKVLGERIGALGGLVEREHWCFAAPMPLPGAHVRIGLAGEPAFAHCDVAFWTGQAVLTGMVDNGATLFGARRRAVEDLERAGIAVVRLAPTWSGAGADPLLEELGPPFSDFTTGVAVPESPFHGRGVPAPVRALRT